MHTEVSLGPHSCYRVASSGAAVSERGCWCPTTVIPQKLRPVSQEGAGTFIGPGTLGSFLFSYQVSVCLELSLLSQGTGGVERKHEEQVI